MYKRTPLTFTLGEILRGALSKHENNSHPTWTQERWTGDLKTFEEVEMNSTDLNDILPSDVINKTDYDEDDDGTRLN